MPPDQVEHGPAGHSDQAHRGQAFHGINYWDFDDSRKPSDEELFQPFEEAGGRQVGKRLHPRERGAALIASLVALIVFCSTAPCSLIVSFQSLTPHTCFAQHAAEVKIRTLKTFGAGGGIIDDD